MIGLKVEKSESEFQMISHPKLYRLQTVRFVCLLADHLTISPSLSVAPSTSCSSGHVVVSQGSIVV